MSKSDVSGYPVSSRREFLKGAGLLAGTTAAELLPGTSAGQQGPAEAALLRDLSKPNGRPV